MGLFGDLLLSTVLAVLLIGGPITLYALIKYISSLLGEIKVQIMRSPAESAAAAPLGFLVTWDSESFPHAVCRVRVDFYELVRGGRSTSFSFTFEDKDSKKKSFFLPMQINSSDYELLTDAGVGGNKKAVSRSYIKIEIENTKGETVRRKIAKAQIIEALHSTPFIASPSYDVLPVKTPDAWSVLTRVFPWRRVVAAAPVAAAAGHAAKPKDAGPKAPTLVDFIVTKVWIEPGCIVCDACENEAPQVFQVLPDTCIVKPDADLADGGSIKAAAEGCPVNVIKFNTAPKPA